LHSYPYQLKKNPFMMKSLRSASSTLLCRLSSRFLNRGRATRPSTGLGSRLRAGIALGLLCLAAASAHAVTCTVDALTDTGAGSGGNLGDLRYCLNHLDTGTDLTDNIIQFSVHGTITLTSTLPTINNGVEIEGPGASLLTISGNNLYNVMVTGADTSILVSGLTIANGNSNNSNDAGGITMGSDSSLLVLATTFTGNQNNANGGGAIADYAGASLRVGNSTFLGNYSLYDGGAINSNSGTTNVSNSTFNGNSTQASGGAIVVNSNSTTALVNDTFIGNGSEVFGGAVVSVARLRPTIIFTNKTRPKWVPVFSINPRSLATIMSTMGTSTRITHTKTTVLTAALTRMRPRPLLTR
jgi:hypothetical protein